MNPIYKINQCTSHSSCYDYNGAVMKFSVKFEGFSAFSWKLKDLDL